MNVNRRDMTHTLLAAAFLALCCGPAAWSEVRLPGLISSSMVLQQGRPVRIWGWADNGETVAVRFQNQAAVTAGKDGRWEVWLGPLEPGGPFTLGVNSVELSDVLVGEVWVCSGQSNMEWPLSAVEESDRHIAAAGQPQIRLFSVPHVQADQPRDDIEAKWEACTPETAREFSAVGYFFGRDLHQARGVPIGLIDSSWGGTPAEAWTRRQVLAEDPELRQLFAWCSQRDAEYEQALVEYAALAAQAEREGKERPGQPWRPWQPSVLYNGMIAPLLPYAIRGVIWYQGESNADRAEQYRRLFPAMIQNWRTDWRLGDFPFLAVQLAPFYEIQPNPTDTNWARLREAQLLATRLLPRVGLAVITDVGDPKDIHPRRKEPVGARLALAARTIAYGEPVTSSGPICDWMEISGDRARLHFQHADDGLVAGGEPLAGFAVAGPDRRFVWANAAIESDTVVVWHESVPNPVAVRYGWADYPTGNLWNKAGLPASPFRTDSFPQTGR